MKKISIALLFLSILMILFACGKTETKYSLCDVVYYTNITEDTYAKYVEKYKDSVSPNQKLQKPKDPIGGDGLTFDGWFLDRKYTKKWDFDKDIVKESITLYAKWIKTDLTITYHFTRGGGFINPSKVVKTYNPGDKIPFLKPEREQSTFIGWFEKDYDEDEIVPIENKITSTENFSKNLNLYAIFKYNEFTIKCHKNPEKKKSVNIKVKFNSKLSSLTDELITPPLPGKTFVGWYTKNGTENGDWGEKVDSSTIYKWTTDIRIYAKWD